MLMFDKVTQRHRGEYPLASLGVASALAASLCRELLMSTNRLTAGGTAEDAIRASHRTRRATGSRRRSSCHSCLHARSIPSLTGVDRSSLRNEIAPYIVGLRRFFSRQIAPIHECDFTPARLLRQSVDTTFRCRCRRRLRPHEERRGPALKSNFSIAHCWSDRL
jgi:hypothetical protein